MGEQSRKIRILLADAQTLFRETVRTVLEEEEDIEVVGEAGDAAQAIEEAKRTRPDIVMLDSNLPARGGIHATALIKERVPGCRVIVLAEEQNQQTLLDSLEAGANGYLAKVRPLAELIDAARRLNRGETLVPGEMLGEFLTRLLARQRDRDDTFRRVARLTPRERDVLGLLIRKADKNAVARALIISPETARTHVQNILTKLGVHSQLEAAALVMRMGNFEDLISEPGSNEAAQASPPPLLDGRNAVGEEASRSRQLPAQTLAPSKR